MNLNFVNLVLVKRNILSYLLHIIFVNPTPCRKIIALKILKVKVHIFKKVRKGFCLHPFPFSVATMMYVCIIYNIHNVINLYCRFYIIFEFI